jgi:hypothetical protein
MSTELEMSTKPFQKNRPKDCNVGQTVVAEGAAFCASGFPPGPAVQASASILTHYTPELATSSWFFTSLS